MANKKIKRLLRITVWVLSVTGLVVLLIAAMSRRDEQVCKNIEIEMKGDGQTLFIDRKDVLDILTANGGRKLKGRTIASIDLKALEAALEKNVWISNAELFFDKDGYLKVDIQENVPVARLFNSNGTSCYIDSAGHRLPLSDKFSARLPVVTGFPSDKPRLDRQDRILMERVKEISRFLQANPFWMAQIAEINITPARQFELYPLVGNHVIEIGDGLDLERRFARLKLFYAQVMKETGVQTWARLKVQYARQVIAIKKGDELLPEIVIPPAAPQVTGTPAVAAVSPVATQQQRTPVVTPVRTQQQTGAAGPKPRAVMPAANRRSNN